MNKFTLIGDNRGDLYINTKTIETVDVDDDGIILIHFVSGNVRRLGPFDESEIGHIIDELEDRFDPVSARLR